MFDLSHDELVWIVNVLKADAHHMDLEGMLLSKTEVDELIHKITTALNTIGRR